MKIDHLSLFIRLNSRWIRDLIIKPDTENMTEKEVEGMLQLTGTERDSLNRSTGIRPTVDTWDLMKIRSFKSF